MGMKTTVVSVALVVLGVSAANFWAVAPSGASASIAMQSALRTMPFAFLMISISPSPDYVH